MPCTYAHLIRQAGTKYLLFMGHVWMENAFKHLRNKTFLHLYRPCMESVVFFNHELYHNI